MLRVIVGNLYIVGDRYGYLIETNFNNIGEIMDELLIVKLAGVMNYIFR